ncbi:MAG: 2-oxoacid:ferredoxin oxidoreductase subunit beta [Bacteroidales bacterium]|jgi:2-oxoglutarate ferredoxin oxidoreductase subunit beta|nr:2-oxoacid:ferredoxin oxidoreductase subunit beta [Bacteroidales bacterium]
MKTTDERIPKSDIELNRSDFVSDQMVKWCPGCGNHAILNSISQLFPRLGYKKENYVVVSGIGCSSRFPYYVSTYGFHGIHGRAAAIASGMKIANPSLSIWVNTGDGDSMAIGGNHFIHAIRRNIDMTIMLFNNQIYGLTKGQYSPTTPMGAITKTSPYGTLETPFNPAELVIGAQGTFFARTADNSPKDMSNILEEAALHRGTAVVELLQNCIIFADKTHAMVTGKEYREENQVFLKHGEPLLYGKDRNKGIRLNKLRLEAVEIGKNGITIDDILVHDQYEQDPIIQLMIAKMAPPHLPMAVGIIRAAKAPTFDRLVDEQIEAQKAKSPIKCVDDLLNSGDIIEIK